MRSGASRFTMMRPARITPGQARRPRPSRVARVHPAEDLGERAKASPMTPTSTCGQQAHDVARHRRQEAAAGDDQRLRGQLRAMPTMCLIERYAVVMPPSAITSQRSARRIWLTIVVRGPPGVGVVDLHLVALAYRDGRQQRLAVRHVARVVLLADERVEEQTLAMGDRLPFEESLERRHADSVPEQDAALGAVHGLALGVLRHLQEDVAEPVVRGIREPRLAE